MNLRPTSRDMQNQITALHTALALSSKSKVILKLICYFESVILHQAIHLLFQMLCQEPLKIGFIKISSAREKHICMNPLCQVTKGVHNKQNRNYHINHLRYQYSMTITETNNLRHNYIRSYLQQL